jgi:hypothetical protein
MISIRSQSQLAFALFFKFRPYIRLGLLCRAAGLGGACRRRRGRLCFHLQIGDIYGHA